MTKLIDRMARAILKTRAPGEDRKAWAREAARNALIAAKYADGADETQLIEVSNSERVEAVSLSLAWDSLIDEHLK